jgi:hypothetical protein
MEALRPLCAMSTLDGSHRVWLLERKDGGILHTRACLGTEGDIWSNIGWLPRMTAVEDGTFWWTEERNRLHAFFTRTRTVERFELETFAGAGTRKGFRPLEIFRVLQ